MIRTCEECGAEIIRSPKSGQREWLAKRFCSPTCGIKHSGNTSGSNTTFEAQNAADRLATDHLRDRMFAAYRSVASKRGLNGVWEAAVLLGMAA